MAIKVKIPYGQNTATVSGLYQWDYGQVLEIESTDLGTMVGEVHFACSNMSEAIVVPCNFVESVCTVTIPNECLEQSSTITAWIYEIAGTQGRTRKVITIPVTARTRPSSGHDIPTEIADQYTQLITTVNEVVGKLGNGEIVVKNAITAETAKSATTAGNASTASYAVSAGSANKATQATNDDLGYPLIDHLCGTWDGFTKYTTGDTLQGGLMAFRVIKDSQDVRIISEVGGRNVTSYSPVFYWESKGSYLPVRLKFEHDGMYMFTITAEICSDSEWGDGGPDIYYQYLSKRYPV